VASNPNQSDNVFALSQGATTKSPGRARRADRGLPNQEALSDLARTYLQVQRSLWPELAASDLLSPAGPEAIAEMAERFRERFIGGRVKPDLPAVENPPWDAVAGSYVRYSDSNSNPRSLDQQLRLQLEKAKQHGHFIPWQFVFADAAVTGTTAARQGYDLAKQALQIDGFKALYIDEIGRASRDAVEALRLGRLVECCGKRLIGVSDGFDSDAPTSKLMLSIFATLQEWFIDQLRSKVHRGMNDAFRRGTNIHPPSLGYRLEPAVDAQGRPLYGKDGDRLKMKVIEPAEAEHVSETFRLFVERHLSRGKIARIFNEKAIGGMRTWTPRGIGDLLRRYTYVGIEIYRQTYQVRDRETGKVTVKKRPRQEWRVRRMRHLQIVPWKLWKRVQNRLDQCREAYKKGRERCGPRRTELYPKVLIRPICGSCGNELLLGRSGKYASMFCLNGTHGKHGCTLKGYKSVRIIETTILDELKNRIFTSEFLERLLAKANEYLAEEASRPREDTGALEAEIRKIQTKRDRFVRILDDEGETDLKPVVDQIRRHERNLKELRVRLDEMRARNQPPPQSLTMSQVETYLEDLRGLMKQDMAVLAPLLRELTGPIIAEQVHAPGKKKPIWVARFTVNAVPILAKLSASRGCPTTDTWEYLKTRGWTVPEAIEVRVEHTPRYQALAQRVASLSDRGTSLVTIAHFLGISWETAKAALDFAKTRKLAKPLRTGRKTGKRIGPPKYIRIADEVSRLRDKEHLSFAEIAKRLNVNTCTVTQAYDSVHRDLVLTAVDQGRTPKRGHISSFMSERGAEIRTLLELGLSPAEVANRVGCSQQTVYRVRQATRVEQGSAQVSSVHHVSGNHEVTG
jgi:DNA invertase Pin-like site-specific DNA recombinase